MKRIVLCVVFLLFATCSPRQEEASTDRLSLEALMLQKENECLERSVETKTDMREVLRLLSKVVDNQNELWKRIKKLEGK